MTSLRLKNRVQSTENREPTRRGIPCGCPKSAKLVQASESQVYLSFYSECSQGSIPRSGVKDESLLRFLLSSKCLYSVICTLLSLLCTLWVSNPFCPLGSETLTLVLADNISARTAFFRSKVIFMHSGV